MKFGLPDTPSKESWLISEFNKGGITGGRVGVDPLLMSIRAGEVMRKSLELHGHCLTLIDNNLVDAVWSTNRRPRPAKPLTILGVAVTGQSISDKIHMVRDVLSRPFKDGDSDIHGHALIVTALDDIAWLFNLRGGDIPYNPVFFAYALVSLSECILFIDENQVSSDLIKHLAVANVTVRPYASAMTEFRSTIAPQLSNPRKFITDTRCNLAIMQALGGMASVHVMARNPIVLAKAIKNPTEINGVMQCHLNDASALITYFAWLKAELNPGVINPNITECTGADKLELLRIQLPDFVGLSFPTISGSGPNGAVIHYKPEKKSCLPIDPKAVYLCDSGAQYLTGTTDVTRTMHLNGTPTDFEKMANTRVLQGHIALAKAIFPSGTTGYTLDGFARLPLWSCGLDYRHGTGHGVGHFLNVHEGPHSISPRVGSLDVPLQKGMMVTNEPGYYHDGDSKQPAFGIRIENVLVVVEKSLDHNFGNVGYLGFESVTFVPFDKALIDVHLLSLNEIMWINAYHQQCWDKVSPKLDVKSNAWLWLKQAVEPIHA